MALGKTDLCNMALSHIFVPTIANFETDPTRQAQQCRIFYEAARQSALADHDWRFASTFRSLCRRHLMRLAGFDLGRPAYFLCVLPSCPTNRWLQAGSAVRAPFRHGSAAGTAEPWCQPRIGIGPKAGGETRRSEAFS